MKGPDDHDHDPPTTPLLKAGAGSRNGRQGTKTFKIQVEDGPGEDPQTSRIKRLFEALGDGDRIKVYRMVDGSPKYVGSHDCDDDLMQNLEERLAGRYGGGDFDLKGYHQGDCVKTARVSIDPKQFPPKEPDGEKAGGPKPPQPSTDPAIVALLERMQHQIAAQEQRFEHLLRQRTTDQHSFVSVVLDLSNKSQERQLALMQAMMGVRSAEPAAKADGLGELQKSIGVLKQIDELRGSTDKAPDNRTLGERVLEAPLSAAATRIGDRIADKFLSGGDSKPSTPPAAATPAPAPAAAPATTPKVVKSLPAGAVRLTAEQFAARRQRLEQQNAAGRATKAPTQPAPNAREVLPNK